MAVSGSRAAAGTIMSLVCCEAVKAGIGSTCQAVPIRPKQLSGWSPLVAPACSAVPEQSASGRELAAERARAGFAGISVRGKSKT